MAFTLRAARCRCQSTVLHRSHFSGLVSDRLDHRADFHRSRSLCWKFQSLWPATSLRNPAAARGLSSVRARQRSARDRPAVTSSKTASAPSSPCCPPRNTVPAYMLSATPSAGIAANDQHPFLHHETGHRPDAAGDDQNSPFHRDARAGRRIAPHDHRPGPNRRCDRVACVAVDRRSCRHACFRRLPSRLLRGR